MTKFKELFEARPSRYELKPRKGTFDKSEGTKLEDEFGKDFWRGFTNSTNSVVTDSEIYPEDVKDFKTRVKKLIPGVKITKIKD